VGVLVLAHALAAPAWRRIAPWPRALPCRAPSRGWARQRPMPLPAASPTIAVPWRKAQTLIRDRPAPRPTTTTRSASPH